MLVSHDAAEAPQHGGKRLGYPIGADRGLRSRGHDPQPRRRGVGASGERFHQRKQAFGSFRVVPIRSPVPSAGSGVSSPRDRPPRSRPGEVRPGTPPAACPRPRSVQGRCNNRRSPRVRTRRPGQPGRIARLSGRVPPSTPHRSRVGPRRRATCPSNRTGFPHPWRPPDSRRHDRKGERRAFPPPGIPGPLRSPVPHRPSSTAGPPRQAPAVRHTSGAPAATGTGARRRRPAFPGRSERRVRLAADRVQPAEGLEQGEALVLFTPEGRPGGPACAGSPQLLLDGLSRGCGWGSARGTRGIRR